MTYKNLWDEAQAVLRENLVPSNKYTREEKKREINDLIYHEARKRIA